MVLLSMGSLLVFSDVAPLPFPLFPPLRLFTFLLSVWFIFPPPLLDKNEEENGLVDSNFREAVCNSKGGKADEVKLAPSPPTFLAVRDADQWLVQSSAMHPIVLSDPVVLRARYSAAPLYLAGPQLGARFVC